MSEYVSVHTAIILGKVDRGFESLATLKRQASEWSNNIVGGTLIAGYHEAITILEQQQEIVKTPADLALEVAEYQRCLSAIEQTPDRYVDPEKAHVWYEQQIWRIQQQLQEMSLVER